MRVPDMDLVGFGSAGIGSFDRFLNLAFMAVRCILAASDKAEVSASQADKGGEVFFYINFIFNPGKQVFEITNISSRDIILVILCCLVAGVILFSWSSLLAG